MITHLRFKPDTASPRGKFDDHKTYPWLYSGQLLGTGCVFVCTDYRKVLSAKAKSIDDYLTEFSIEVAAKKTARAKQYLHSYRSGQRVLWTFDGDDTILLSLVVNIKGALSTVMFVGHVLDICDQSGNFLHHAEAVIRQGIELDIGISMHPESCK